MEDVKKTASAFRMSRPRIQRVYVQVRDPDSNESKTMTVYNATVAEVVQLLSSIVPDVPQEVTQLNG